MPRKPGRTRGGVAPRGRKGKSATTSKPDIYGEMLADAASDPTSADDSERPRKRRQTAKSAVTANSSIGSASKDIKKDDESDIEPDKPHPYRLRGIGDRVPGAEEQQEEAESDESEMDWEEVGLDESAELEDAVDDGSEDQEDLSIVLGETPAKHQQKLVRPRTQPLLDKRIRTEVHKLHFLCLLAHGFLRNHWCNLGEVHDKLRGLGDPKMRRLLFPDRSGSQAVKTASFTDGLTQVCQMWRTKYRITSVGQRAPRWARSTQEVREFELPEHVEPRISRGGFYSAAETLEGSQDTGAALLCAFLRSIGVQTRLVCSLQMLNLVSAPSTTTGRTPSNTKKTIYIYDSEDDAKGPAEQPETKVSISIPPPRARAGLMNASGISRTSGRRIFEESSSMDLGKAPSQVQKKTIHESFPVFWVEAFNKHIQKWVPVDPHATYTVGKPSKLEPPLAYKQNVMAYVIAFEKDGVARDVTRRYAKAFVGKTRRLRVESIEGGELWLKRAMKMFKRQTLKARDQVEVAELASKEAQEPMPRNVQDFKDHPYYVLERHLKQSEILYPKQEAGRVNTGGNASGRQEAVYRRRDVHIVRSADKWFRLGREVKEGEQPLKYAFRRRAAQRSRRGHSDASLDEEDDDDERKPLYALFQTELYIPPPVVGGRVPKNAYRNLDIYVPSMIPAGGVHIRAPLAARAARLVGVDYADAVTGFQFQGRTGSAVVQGAIVAAEYQEAVEAVVEGLQYAESKSKETERSFLLLSLWRRFITGMKIAKRIKEEHGEVEGGEQIMDDASDVHDPAQEMEQRRQPYDDESAVHQTDQPTRLLPLNEDLVGFENTDLSSYAPNKKRRVWIERPMQNIVDWYDDLDLGATRTPSTRKEEVDRSKHAQTSSSNRASMLTPGPSFDLKGIATEGKGKNRLIEDSFAVVGERQRTADVLMKSEAPLEEYGCLGGGFIPEESDPVSNQDAKISDIDAGSLASHDPEDEDAEPDWLMSDAEE
ncbi:Rad4-domain-containing protein [Eremomyces bilateralis CBS 781.70]|uniref:Rad4-domain-containing protein n=1 Tax=Eremomyces bilateralis CBS 781.70 TaxID=1392243 RepID=A0A6G1G674_9PEZI|nr:Rad4-domain-containing protein [Eremomyces bilateralis CBS 781.70]KAF1813426.1 Rad4-domain-containing protein [Eremomyces bilateralis CBS 781.70]